MRLTMYKVYLLDDEPFILEGLKYIVDWQNYGFEIVDDFFSPRPAAPSEIDGAAGLFDDLQAGKCSRKPSAAFQTSAFTNIIRCFIVQVKFRGSLDVYIEIVYKCR